MLLVETYYFLLFILLLLLDNFPELLWLVRHINMRHTQRVSDSGSYSWCRANRASLTNPFHSQGVYGRQCNSMIKLKMRELRGDWHSVIHQGCCQKLAIFRVLNSLDKGLT